MEQKRVVTKVGDVYKLNAYDDYFLQLVALDPINMNSDVVAVFKGDVGAEDSKLEFYTHTTTSVGVKFGLWEKISKEAVSVDVSKLTFKNYNDDLDSAAGTDPTNRLGLPNWMVWTPPDDDFRYVSEEEGKNIVAEDGSIYPATDIVYRIEHGQSEFISNWPK